MQVRTVCSTVSYANTFSRENNPQSFVFPNESSVLKTVDCALKCRVQCGRVGTETHSCCTNSCPGSLFISWFS